MKVRGVSQTCGCAGRGGRCGWMARDGNRPVEIQHESNAAVQAHRRARPHLSRIDEQREDQGAHACRHSRRVLSDVARQQGSYSYWYSTLFITIPSIISLSCYRFKRFN